MPSSRVRHFYAIRGAVQGVGFRPAVYRWAREAGLGGWVRNRGGDVLLALEGAPEALAEFVRGLPGRLPGHARLDECRLLGEEPAPAEAGAGFEILDSELDRPRDALIPPDLAVCPDCLREVFDPRDRRFGYPFTTCTRCGPRYTVVEAMPYDRQRTTLSRFPLCERCNREYHDPADRRFHAESTACPACGPRLSLLDADGRPLGGDAIPALRAALAAGRIAAVRGIGGFLLAADATNRAALSELRRRKRRPHKPFALMARNLAAVRAVAEVTPAGAGELGSAAAPIVVFDPLPGAARRLPLDLIAPDTGTLGMMLPTSPLHALLFTPLPGDPEPPFDLLVMTSGNRRSEPICLSNAEALDRLHGIADLFLCHDREINLRCDDSLCAMRGGKPQLWRRARGYAPDPLPVRPALRRCVLAMGAELRNAVALGAGGTVTLSPHVGDLDTPEAVSGLEQVVDALPSFLNRAPEAVAVDLHPDMACARLGAALARKRGLPLARVQHHHAHAAACLAEHGRSHGLALAFDGTGLGSDGSIWGSELLHVTREGFRRLATFRPVPLPGGDAAVMQPVRQLVARWVDAGVPIDSDRRARLGLDEESAAVWREQCRRGPNAPLTHGAGRLFDAVSALLGLAPPTTTYEGQPAVRLEAAARCALGSDVPRLPVRAAERDGLLLVDWREAFRLLADAKLTGGREREWALALHLAVAEAALLMLDYGFGLASERTVALTGGVFMNRILTERLSVALRERGVEPLLHRAVPPNDACVALGQAVIAGQQEQ